MDNKLVEFKTGDIYGEYKNDELCYKFKIASVSKTHIFTQMISPNPRGSVPEHIKTATNNVKNGIYKKITQ